ncbi:MAG: Rossmann-like and DUF2520 domain-containing protein [Chloroflexota bacterium]
MTSRMGIIGMGRLGSALAHALTAAGMHVGVVWSRSLEGAASAGKRFPEARIASDVQEVAATSNLVFITTSDGAIASLAESVSWRSDHAVVHCSGALDRSVLAAVSEAGGCTGSFHPLQSFTEISGASAFTDIVIGVEADGALEGVLVSLARQLGARPHVLVPGTKGQYHAGAVMASNYLVTLASAASRLLRSSGFTDDEALSALLPLMRGALQNLSAVGIPAALTGPISRGDGETVRRHVEAIAAECPELVDFYIQLAQCTLPLAQEQGRISADQMRNLVHILTTPRTQERTASCA